MSSTGLEVFDSTLNKTFLWLNGVMDEMGWEDRHRAYSALRAVLHAVRDRLPPDEAVNLAAQLPMLIRGFYYEGWHPADKPLKYRHKEDFLEAVQNKSPMLDSGELESTISAVFKVLSEQAPGGEVEQVKTALPAEVRELWH